MSGVGPGISRSWLRVSILHVALVLAAELGLFAYAFVSNVALALVPHEPVIVWGGAQLGVWRTASIATAATVLAAWVDHRLFVPLISRIHARRAAAGVTISRWERMFRRAPFAIIALSGVTPLPFFPFKALAFSARYPLSRYLGAVAAGRFPRYAAMAWFGQAIHPPFWLLAALFVLLLIPTVRILAWPPLSSPRRRPAN